MPRISLGDGRDPVPQRLDPGGRVREACDPALQLRRSDGEQGAEDLGDEPVKRGVIEEPDRLLVRQRAAGRETGLECVDKARLADARISLDDGAAAHPRAHRGRRLLQLRRPSNEEAARRVERVTDGAQLVLEERVALQAERSPAIGDGSAHESLRIEVVREHGRYHVRHVKRRRATCRTWGREGLHRRHPNDRSVVALLVVQPLTRLAEPAPGRRAEDLVPDIPASG